MTDTNDTDDSPKARAIAFGVKAYVDTFPNPPPATARELEVDLMDLEDTLISNPIQQALDLAEYADFVALVMASRSAVH